MARKRTKAEEAALRRFLGEDYESIVHKGAKRSTTPRRKGEYQGHKNWSQWNVSLWINNDEGTYREAEDLCKRYGRRGGARRLLQELPKKTPDGASYSFASVYAAMDGMSCKR